MEVQEVLSEEIFEEIRKTLKRAPSSDYFCPLYYQVQMEK